MFEYLYGGMLLISIVLIYFSYRHYYSTKELINQGIKTTATVIDLIQIRGDDGYTYKPVFKYTNRAGAEIEFKSEISSSPPAYKTGDRVQIIYSKDGDERKVVSFWGLYRWTIVLLTIASPLLIIGGGYIMYTKGYI